MAPSQPWPPLSLDPPLGTGVCSALATLLALPPLALAPSRSWPPLGPGPLMALASSWPWPPLGPDPLLSLSFSLQAYCYKAACLLASLLLQYFLFSGHNLLKVLVPPCQRWPRLGLGPFLALVRSWPWPPLCPGPLSALAPSWPCPPLGLGPLLSLAPSWPCPPLLPTVRRQRYGDDDTAPIMRRQ